MATGRPYFVNLDPEHPHNFRTVTWNDPRGGGRFEPGERRQLPPPKPEKKLVSSPATTCDSEGFALAQQENKIQPPSANLTTEIMETYPVSDNIEKMAVIPVHVPKYVPGTDLERFTLFPKLAVECKLLEEYRNEGASLMEIHSKALYTIIEYLLTLTSCSAA